MRISHHPAGVAEIVASSSGERGAFLPFPSFHRRDVEHALVVGPETTVDLAPFYCPDPQKLSTLREMYMDIATAEEGADLAPETVEYFAQEGAGIRLLLWEITELSPPRHVDIAREQARKEYVQNLVNPSKKLWKHGQQRAQEDAARENYVDHIMARITEVIDADSAQDALDVRQMPSLVDRASFRDGEDITVQDLAANHLYVLIDTILKERALIGHDIGEYQGRNLFARLSSSPIIRFAGGLAAAAAVAFPRLGIIPRDNEAIAEEIELGLKILSSGILIIEGPELVRGAFRLRLHQRRINKLHDTLSRDRDLADHALGLAYNSTRVGGTKHYHPVHERYAKDDPAENIALFRKFDEVFPHLNNDPGGKPYSGDQVLLYAGRLFVDRPDELEAIIDPTADAETRRQRYLELCRGIIEEDLARLRKDRIESRYRRVAVNIAMLPLAILFKDALSTGSEMKTVGVDTAHTIDREGHLEE